jgi:hypothetical protein
MKDQTVENFIKDIELHSGEYKLCEIYIEGDSRVTSAFRKISTFKITEDTTGCWLRINHDFRVRFHLASYERYESDNENITEQFGSKRIYYKIQTKGKKFIGIELFI